MIFEHINNVKKEMVAGDAAVTSIFCSAVTSLGRAQADELAFPAWSTSSTYHQPVIVDPSSS